MFALWAVEDAESMLGRERANARLPVFSPAALSMAAMTLGYPPVTALCVSLSSESKGFYDRVL